MDAKLTLKLDKEVIDKAKEYASAHRKSLSRMIESYLKSLVDKDQPDSESEISSFVKSMQTGASIPSDLNYKDEIGQHFLEKYK